MSPAQPDSVSRVHPYEVLLGRWSVGVALAVVVGTIAGASFFDPERIGTEFCWLRALSGLPCPGCGLTRSVCHLARGDAAQALWFHPFGLLVLPFSVTAASSLLWPAAFRARVRRAIDRHRGGVESTYRAVVLVFLAYGFLRAVAVAAGVWPGWG